MSGGEQKGDGGEDVKSRPVEIGEAVEKWTRIIERVV